MFKYLAIFTLFALAAAKPGFVEQHHVIQPVVAKVGAVVHTAPSAVSYQSITQVHNKAHIVTPIVPVVKTFVTPVVHAAPVAHVVKTYAAPTVVKTIQSAPVVHHSYVAAPAVVKTVHHAIPVVQKSYVVAPAVVKTIATPVFNVATSHQSHTQIHHKKAIITPIVTPVVKSYIAAPVVPVIHAHAHVAKTYLH